MVKGDLNIYGYGGLCLSEEILLYVIFYMYGKG